MSALLLMLAGLLAGAEPVATPDVVAAITVADEHRKCGRHAEALEAYDALAEQPLEPEQLSAVTIGRSLALEETGEWELATAAIRAIVKEHPHAALWARLAELEYRQGRYDGAKLACEAALKLDTNCVPARVIEAHVLRETGEFDRAIAGYLWCVRYYNRVQPKDAETLLALAEGSLEYARWKRATKIFDFVVNTLCPEALKGDPQCWQAYALAGGLLLEKYNQGQAETELNRGLAVNPHSAAVLTLLGRLALETLKIERAEELADRALAVNPNLPETLLLKADLRLAVGEPETARVFVAQALAVNPVDQRIKAREAVCCLLEDGAPAEEELLELFLHLDAIDTLKVEQPSRFAQIVIDIAETNPRPGDFLSLVGSALDAQRLYESAELFYRQAIVTMPQLAAPKANLAMLFMRTGRIDDAGKMLDEAFKLDPFHVRVSNMRKVVGVLEGYETLSTDHFVLKFKAADRLLARMMGEKLESCYAELTGRYRYEPPARTPFELYGAADGQSAHEWFSARMVGLPWVQTIGASTGMIVALASPTQREPYNWARVARHEFVHILTLQKTNFQIPHWYTEALAVREEGGGLSEEWQGLLLDRVPRGEVFNLTTLNGGFQRPRDGDDWQFAYCQSYLYSEYFVERFGDDSLTKLLDAYCATRETDVAVRQAFGVELAEVEAGYAEFLAKTVAGLQARRAPPRPTLESARTAHETDMSNLDAAGRYALALQNAEQFKSARELAERVAAERPTQPDAAIVLARVALTQNYEEHAMELLEPVLDPEAPHAGALALLARLRLDDRQNEAAAKLYELGTVKFPGEDRYWNGLAIALWRIDDPQRLRPVLEHVAARDYGNAAVRKKLAQITQHAGEFEEAARWGEEAVCIDIEDAEVHTLLAECYDKLGKSDLAMAAREAAREMATHATDDRPSEEPKADGDSESGD